MCDIKERDLSLRIATCYKYSFMLKTESFIKTSHLATPGKTDHFYTTIIHCCDEISTVEMSVCGGDVLIQILQVSAYKYNPFTLPFIHSKVTFQR